MSTETENVGFFVWGLDKAAYGPVELPTLVAWIKDGRVFPETWLFDERTERWQLAGSFVELQPVFKPRGTGAAQAAPAAALTTVTPGALRRVKILGSFGEQQLERFAAFMEAEKVRQWSVVVKQGDMSDAMYLILDGELRVRISVGGAEKILATLTVGEFFGDIALFDRGPRSADVVANVDSLLLRVSAKAFDRLCKEAPELATPFLLAVGKTLTARIRADNKRYHDTLYFNQAAGRSA